jgi:ADP-ribose pyrophosphatase
MPIVFKGRVFSVEVDKKRFPNGSEHEVAVVRHQPAVVVIPLEADGRVVLIRQFRAAIDRELWEVPAGSLDDAEPADAAAKRECEEEIGRAPQRVQRLASM